MMVRQAKSWFPCTESWAYTARQSLRTVAAWNMLPGILPLLFAGQGDRFIPLDISVKKGIDFEIRFQ